MIKIHTKNFRTLVSMEGNQVELMVEFTVMIKAMLSYLMEIYPEELAKEKIAMCGRLAFVMSEDAAAKEMDVDEIKEMVAFIDEIIEETNGN